MKDPILLRFWFVTYYISAILIPFAILFGFVFNHFNIFNMIFSILACTFQTTMMLGLQLRDHKALFIWSTILLTFVHIATLVYLIFMTITLTDTIRQDLETDIFTNRTEYKISSLTIDKCCRLDRLSAKSDAYFYECYPQHCRGSEHREKPCWPSFRMLSHMTKVVYWLTWFCQCVLLLLAWMYYFRIGNLNEQPRISPRKTLHQVYSEIIVQSRPYKLMMNLNDKKKIDELKKQEFSTSDEI